MNFKPLACQNLRDYRAVKTGVENLKNRLDELNDKISNIRVIYDPDRSPGGGSSTTSEEDKLLIAQDEVVMLKPVYEYKRNEVERIERSLRILTAEQRLILTRFHISRPENHIDVLCNELHIEKSQVYDRHEAALRAFTKAMYAIVDG